MTNTRKKKPAKKKEVVKKTGKELIPAVQSACEIIGNDTRLAKTLIGIHCFGLSLLQAGQAAGYSKQYCASGLIKAVRDGKKADRVLKDITKKMPGLYRSMNAINLFDVAKLEQKALQVLDDQPELIIRHPGLLKQIKGVAGVLQDDQPPQPTINIHSLQVLQQTIGADLDRTLHNAEVL